MAMDKIDARLRAEMQRLERADQAGERLAVLVEHVHDGDPARSSAGGIECERPVRRELKRRLAEIGAEDVEELVLADAVVCRLSPAQVRTVADDPHVKRMLLNLPENIAL